MATEIVKLVTIYLSLFSLFTLNKVSLFGVKFLLNLPVHSVCDEIYLALFLGFFYKISY